MGDHVTLVFGFNGLNEVILVADSRVSFDNNLEPKDILLKVYSFVGIHPPMALGFSGRLSAIKRVMEFLSKEKLRNPPKRVVVPEFAQRLRGWIEHIVKTEISQPERKGLAFLLGGLEPGRPPKSYKQDGSYSYLNLPSGYLYRYNVNPTTGGVTISANGPALAIGSGADIIRELERKGMEYLSAGFGNEFAPAFRATIIASDIASTYRNLHSRTVGGPFQLVRLTPSRHYEAPIFAPEENKGDPIVNQASGVRQLSFPDLGEIYPLYSIYQLDLANIANLESASAKS